MLYIGFRYVMKATKNYRESENPVFNSSVIGMETEYWDRKNKNMKQYKKAVQLNARPFILDYFSLFCGNRESKSVGNSVSFP